MPFTLTDTPATCVGKVWPGWAMGTMCSASARLLPYSVAMLPGARSPISDAALTTRPGVITGVVSVIVKG